MSSKSEPDFRKELNTILNIYYDRRNILHIHQEVSRLNLPISKADVNAAYSTLMKDKHIEHAYHEEGFIKIPVGSITGQGRIFFEAGGYQDETTQFDKIIKWTKNNKFLAWLLIAFVVISALIGVAVSIITIVEFFQPTP
jgi:uncharacterized protein YqhQ